MAELTPLFSGSRGNCYHVGDKKSGILIDAGRSAKQICQMLSDCSIDPKTIEGVVVTHEHSDHVSGLRVFCKKFDIPVFSSQGTMAALENNKVADGSFDISVIEKNLQIAGMEITPFNISHDCMEGFGYKVRTRDGKILTLATDLGHITEEVLDNLYGCDYAIIESNHDVGMLKIGPYPYQLKRRILSDIGHLSNETCADLMPVLHRSGVKHFMLAHLSDENNTKEVAYQTSLCKMTMEGYVENSDFTITVAPKQNIKFKTIEF